MTNLSDLIERVGTWPCGHFRTAENTASVGKAGVRCRQCRNVTTREHVRRRTGYYERHAAGPGQPRCEGCGSAMVRAHFDEWQCSAGCPLSTGEWPEYSRAGQMMMSRSASLRALQEKDIDHD